MRIAYFGGSFDPPHYGHLAIAIAAASAFSLDRVLFAPTGRQPLKSAGPVASYTDRLAMVSLLCSEPHQTVSAFEPSDIDQPRPDGSPNYTVDTLTDLRSKLLPCDTLYAILGADAFLDIPRWHNAEVLFELAQWIVVSRPGFDLDRPYQLLGAVKDPPRVYILDSVQSATSATQIREQLRSHRACGGLLPQSVLQYIDVHHLYGK